MTKDRWIAISKISAVVAGCVAMGFVAGGCSGSSNDDDVGWGNPSGDAGRDAKAEARSDVDVDDSSSPGADGGSDSEGDVSLDGVVSDSTPSEDVYVPDVRPDAPAETEPDPAAAENARNEIISMAAGSACASYKWKDRGKAPAAYMKGMALLFGRAVCNQTRTDIAYVAQAQPSDKGTDDTFVEYKDIFAGLGMSNDVDGVDTLRHAYTLLLGLGMRESTGRHCVGRDTNASNTSAATAEAGAWQTSYNSNYFNKTILLALFEKYKADRSGCLLDVFSEGVTCSKAHWENYGTGEGLLFQELSKSCPAFAGEWAAVMLRSCYRHYGPLKRHEAEVRPDCDDMFKQVQDIVAKTPTVCALL